MANRTYCRTKEIFLPSLFNNYFKCHFFSFGRSHPQVFIEINIISMIQTPCYTKYERNTCKFEDFLATDDDNL